MNLRKCFRPWGAGRSSNAKSGFRPRRLELERLEDRLAPAVHTWIGPSGNHWSNSFNWTGGVPTTGEPGGTIVRFDNGTESVDDLPGLVVGQIDFASDGNTISTDNGATLGILGSGAFTIRNAVGNNTISVPLAVSSGLFVVVEAGELSLANSISGNGSVFLEGSASGTLRFAGDGANTYGGPTAVFEGTLLLDKNGNAVAIPSTYLSIGGSVDLPGPAIVRLAQPSQINDASLVFVAKGGQLDFDGFAETIGRLQFACQDLVYAQATTAAGTASSFTIDGLTTTLNANDQVLNSITAGALGGMNGTATVLTNDTFNGTETAEEVRLGPGGGTLYRYGGNGLYPFLTLGGFNTCYAYVGRADSAQLIGVTGEDIENVFVTAGNYSYEFGGGQFNLISGAASVYGYAVNPTDQAWHYDAAGSLDSFVTSGNAFSYMSGSDAATNSFFNVAVGFDVSYGIATHGKAIAYMIDSPGDDVLACNGAYSYLSGSDDAGSVFNVAEGFLLVYGQTFVGGMDFAYNNDPAHNILGGHWIRLA